MVADSVLISLAILKTNWDEQRRSYLHNFVPFVADCLAAASQREVALPDVQAAMRDRFGMNLPQGVLRTILNRAAKEGVVEKSHGVYIRNEKRLKDFDLSVSRSSAARDHEALLHKFREYCSQQLGHDLGEGDAESLLTGFIQERGLPILKSIIVGEALDFSDLKEGAREEFLVSSFVTHLFESDPLGFAFLETVVKGCLLASAVFLPPGTAQQRFSETEIFLDTPFLLRALGFEGKAAADAGQELLALCHATGGRLRCFTHTLDEMSGVLEACAHSLRPGARTRDAPGRIQEFCIQEGMGASDLELAAAALPGRIRTAGVSIVDAPPITTSLSVDETKLEELLYEEVPGFRPETLLHDLKCITAIHRLRAGHSRRFLESSGALFVTPNLGVVRASRHFFDEELTGNRIPHVYLDYEFMTVLWLKKPVEAEDLPTRQMIADCYAAMKPGGALWKRYIDEVERLRADDSLTDDAYHVLKFSLDARQTLMEVTKGEVEAFTSGTVDEVLERARRNARADLETRLSEEEGAREEEKGRRRAAELRAEEETTRGLVQKKKQAERIDTIAGRIASWMHRALLYGIATVLFFVILLSLPPFSDLLQQLSGWVAFLLSLGMFALAFLTVIEKLWGFEVREELRAIERSIAAKLADRLKTLLIPDDGKG